METSKFILLPVLLLLLPVTVASTVNRMAKPAREEQATSFLEILKSVWDNTQRHFISWIHFFNIDPRSYDSDQFMLKRDTERDHLKFKSVPAIVTTTKEPECHFEDYEKQYFIFQIMNLLEQLIEYQEYRKSLNHNTSAVLSTLTPQNATPSMTDGNRVDAILERNLHRLQQMRNHQLDELFHNIRHVAQKGAIDVSISGLCCSI